MPTRVSLVLFVVLMCAAAPALRAQADASAEVRALTTAWERAWNSHDMKGLAVLFTEDADFVDVGAKRWKGRAEIEAQAVDEGSVPDTTADFVLGGATGGLIKNLSRIRVCLRIDQTLGTPLRESPREFSLSLGSGPSSASMDLDHLPPRVRSSARLRDSSSQRGRPPSDSVFGSAFTMSVFVRHNVLWISVLRTPITSGSLL